MAFQVMVSIEALCASVASERTVIWLSSRYSTMHVVRIRARMPTVHLLETGGMTTVESRQEV